MIPESLARACDLIRQAEQHLARGDAMGSRTARGLAEEALRLLEGGTVPPPPRLRAAAWRTVARACAAEPCPHAAADAMAAMDEALRWCRRDSQGGTAAGRAAQAELWMQRGLLSLSSGRADGLEEAVRSFDEAIRLRAEKPGPGDAWGWYAWLGAWINRADALTRRRRGDDLERAMEAHAVVHSHLSCLPDGGAPEFRERHAVAWLHHGLTLCARARPGDRAWAARSFERALQVAEACVPGTPGRMRAVVASARLNLAGVRLREDVTQAAWVGVEASLVREAWRYGEGGYFLPDDVGLAAVLLECQAAIVLAQTARPPEAAGLRRELAPSLVEVVVTSLQTLATRLGPRASREGVQVASILRCVATQVLDVDPRLMLRLVREGLGETAWAGDAAVRSEVLEAWRTLLARVQHGVFSSLNTPRFDRVLETLEVLEELRLWLILTSKERGAADVDPTLPDSGS